MKLGAADYIVNPAALWTEYRWRSVRPWAGKPFAEPRREASGGTLFLDEAGEMPATIQAKLLLRCNVFPICLPALRDRRSDIPLLANHLLEVLAELVAIWKHPKITAVGLRMSQATSDLDRSGPESKYGLACRLLLESVPSHELEMSDRGLIRTGFCRI